MKHITAALIILSSLLISCNNNPNGDEKSNVNHEQLKEKGYTANMIVEIVSSVPNPLEMSTLLRKSGVVFNKDLLNSVKNVENYESDFSKALNLGIYGTDFIHMNIYKNSEKSDEYLENIKKLVDDLGVGDLLYYDGLKKLVQSGDNVDSLLFLMNISFDRISMHFIDNDQSSNSVLMAYGTWIESLYLATNIKKVTNAEQVSNRIGEQKNVLDNLYLLISLYNNQKEFRELMVDLKLLRGEFDNVKITYQYNPPTTEEIDGNLVIIDNSTSSIKIDSETIIEIGKIVSAIRNKIIS